MNGLLGTADDPRTMGLLSMGLRLMSTPGKFGSAFGQAGLGAMGDMQQAQQMQEQRKRAGLQEQLVMLQLAQAKAQQEQAAAMQARKTRDDEILAGSFRPLPGPMPDGQAGVQPRFDIQGMLGRGLSMDSVPEAIRLQQVLNPGPKLRDVAPGASVIDERDPTKPLYTAPKEDAVPSDWRLYQLSGAPQRGVTFDAWDQARRKAGATNIGMPKIDIKMGESVAGQIGPMAKDSRVQVGGAVTMWDAADRLGKALESGKVTSGPLASKVQTVKQFVQVIAGGNDESIRQTQQAIRSLSKMAVEARKQLQGQGQVTENEAKAVEKADGGNIDDMTTGELGDLVTLTKRAAHLTAKGHQELLDEMERNEATRGSAPFYRVRGLEPLLKHDPQLPKIGGAKLTPQEAAELEQLRNRFNKRP
jgi:hypothetical protein